MGVTAKILESVSLIVTVAPQAGRLVCLVCYQLLGPGEHAKYRRHVAQHARYPMRARHLVT